MFSNRITQKNDVMKDSILSLLTVIFSVLTIIASGQNQSTEIDPKWDKYYEDNPSEIETKHSATDFIRIIDLVNFTPQNSMYKKDVQLMKTILLMCDAATLQQMMMNGWYHSRTIKHDDYFTLYNLYYNKISKQAFDKYCPYLLVLMDMDKLINAH
jgi:hypothetical protein